MFWYAGFEALCFLQRAFILSVSEILFENLVRLCLSLWVIAGVVALEFLSFFTALVILGYAAKSSKFAVVI